MENEENVVKTEETVEQTQTVQQTQSQNQQPTGNGGANNIISWAKSHLKIIGIVAIAVIALIIIISIIANQSPESAVKNYVNAFNSLNGKKVASATDVKGYVAYANASVNDDDSSSYLSTKKFDAGKFEEAYKNVDKDKVEEAKEKIIDSFDFTDSQKEEFKKRKFKISLLKIKESKESDKCKKLYEVKAKLRIEYNDEDGDKQSVTDTVTFWVYKNKVVHGDLTSLFMSSL